MKDDSGIKGIQYSSELKEKPFRQIPLTAVRVVGAAVKPECEQMGFKVGEVWFLNPTKAPFTQDQLEAAHVTLSDLVDHCKTDEVRQSALSLFETFNGTDAKWHIVSKEVAGGVVISGIVAYQEDYDQAKKKGLVTR